MSHHLLGTLVCTALALLFTGKVMAKTDQEIFDMNRMAVVQIQIPADPSSPNREPERATGFLIGGDGIVLTAAHVFSGYVSSPTAPIKVHIGSLGGPEVVAELLMKDANIDVAMLKLRNPIDIGLDYYQTVSQGDSSHIAPGEQLVVVGFNLTENISVHPASLASNFGGGVGGDLLPNLPSFIRRVCSSVAPGRGVLRTRLVL